MSSAALEVHNLTLISGERRILDVPNLRVEIGNLLALMGPNGAGKTTLLRSFLGLVPHINGEITVLGEVVGALGGGALASLRRRIGYVPQLLPSHSELPLTVREVVAIGRTARAGLLRRLARDDWDTIDHWIQKLGLSSLAHRGFSHISGGEQRKTILARAMAQEPELLLLDEPTANLDLGWRERMVETIGHLHEMTRVTVVLVCHELEVLPPACRQVMLLDGGAVRAAGTPEEVFTAGNLQQLYGAPFQVLHREGRHAVIPGGGGP